MDGPNGEYRQDNELGAAGVEYKAFNDQLADAFAGTPLAPSPLSPLSGVYAFTLAPSEQARPNLAL